MSIGWESGPSLSEGAKRAGWSKRSVTEDPQSPDALAAGWKLLSSGDLCVTVLWLPGWLAPVSEEGISDFSYWHALFAVNLVPDKYLCTPHAGVIS